MRLHLNQLDVVGIDDPNSSRMIEEMKEVKGLGNRLEKVEQDQPLPTYQKEEMSVGKNSDQSENKQG